MTALACVVVSTPSLAQSVGSSQARWRVAPSITASVTPNYQSGFGPSGGAGSGQTVAVGSLASLGGGYVDFGNVVAGYQYLYKYAAQIAIVTNDTSGFTVYGEGSTDFQGTTATPPTFPISSTLFWVVSSSSNTPYSPATPFEKTSAMASGSPTGTGITYSGAPPASAVIWSNSSSGSLTRGYDYELHLDASIPISQFDVYIVYTAIPN